MVTLLLQIPWKKEVECTGKEGEPDTSKLKPSHKAKAAAAAEEEERKKVLGAVVCARVLDSHAVLRSLLTRKSLHRFTPFLDNAFFLLTPLAPISSAFCSRFFVSFFKFTLGPRGGRCEVGSKERRRGRPCCRG
jgi:hypothetical protein